MGQYYIPVVISNGETFVSNGYLDGEYEFAKLMEHSWIKNQYVNSVCSMIYKHPSQVYWVGDYADYYFSSHGELNGLGEGEQSNVYKMAYGENVQCNPVKNNPLDLNGKFLVNHTKATAINLDDYAEYNDVDGWIVHPLPLLTAIGNGRGGGDYHGSDAEWVGAWIGDLISIEDTLPDGIEIIMYSFRECPA